MPISWWPNRGVRTRREDKAEAELTVGYRLLGMVDLGGLVVTGDSLYAQKKVARRIVARGGDYLLVVKENQPELLWSLELLFASPPAGEVFPRAKTRGRHGDRREERELLASAALNDYLDWPRLAQVCRIERRVERKGRERVEVGYAITSLGPERAGPKRLAALWRGHWRIENRLHWVRDESMGEDRCQVRTGRAPEVMATLRNLALGLLRLAGTSNVAAALRRYARYPEEALGLIGLPSSITQV